MNNFKLGEVYTNRNGDQYIVKKTTYSKTIMERISDGWTLVAHVVKMYPDGTIEWDYSTGGHWPEKSFKVVGGKNE